MAVTSGILNDSFHERFKRLQIKINAIHFYKQNFNLISAQEFALLRSASPYPTPLAAACPVFTISLSVGVNRRLSCNSNSAYRM